MSDLSTSDLIQYLKGEEDVGESIVAKAREEIADAREIASNYVTSSDEPWPIAYLLSALRQRDRHITALQSALWLAGESVRTASEQAESVAKQNIELVGLCEQYREAAQVAIDAGRQLQAIASGRK